MKKYMVMILACIQLVAMQEADMEKQEPDRVPTKRKRPLDKVLEIIQQDRIDPDTHTQEDIIAISGLIAQINSRKKHRVKTSQES